MDAERWELIQRLVQEALLLPVLERRSFLTSACGEDSGLQSEVVSLLAACERSAETYEPPIEWFDVLTDERPSFEAGELVAQRYRVKGLLGRGGMGEVFEAKDEELSIDVALKTLHIPGDKDDAERRLKLEGLLARSVWHPNVCRLYDLGVHRVNDEATWFLTMELLQGETLSERLARGRIPLELARSLAEQMSAGLGAAHQAGVIHRDLKPDNIMLVQKDGREHAIVMDFGIAQTASASGEATTRKHPVIGTPVYMSPEQLRGEEVSPTSDLYALGLVLFEMVTGVRPWSGDTPSDEAARRLSEEPRIPIELAAELGPRWEATLLRCLAREPRDRFARAEDVALALLESTPIETIRSGATATVAQRGMPSSHRLPPERDLFVGREAELEQVARDFAEGARVVTLLGAGGMGKTRLALRYAWQTTDAWPGGVGFCDLTDARDDNEIASAAARALEIQLGRGDPVEQLGHVIAARGHCLLLLDNVEQIADRVAATLDRWLARSGAARFLITSRQKLDLGGAESVVTLGSLPLEAGLELFLSRARRLRPGLELSGVETGAAREIVKLVDGMPLAIELAGARMRVMSAEQIVSQMRRRFSLLTGGATARHETLAIAIDGSWELLAPWEKAAWTQCSVFEGGFTLEAAEAIVDLRSWPDAPWVIDVMQSLVDKSLLRTSSDAIGRGAREARFGMLATLQEYARLKLRDVDPGAIGEGSVNLAERRHGEWYARYGQSAAIAKLALHGGLERRQRLERELDNLLAACRRALARGDAEACSATYQAAWAVLELRGPFGVAVDLGRELLLRLQLAPSAHAMVLRTLGQAELFSGMAEQSRDHLEAALSIANELGDRRLEAVLLSGLGGLRVSLGKMEEGAASLEIALAGALDAGDQALECSTRNTLSVAYRGLARTTLAREQAKRALAIARSKGDRRLEGNILSNLGLILQDEGRAEDARAHFEDALAVHRVVGNRRFEGNARNNLGTLAYDHGRVADARVHWEAALVVHRETGSRDFEAIALANLGSLCHREGQHDDARAYFEAGLAVVRELGNRRLEGLILTALGTWHEDHGDLETAERFFESALALHRTASDHRSAGVALRHLAVLHLRRGSIDAASLALDDAEPQLRSLDARFELGLLLCVRAELDLASGRGEDASARLSEAEGLASRVGADPDSELERSIARVRDRIAAVGRNDQTA